MKHKLSTKKSTPIHFLLFVISLISLSGLIGCKNSNQASLSGSSDSPTINPPVGVVDDNAGFYVRYITSSAYTYVMHKGTGAGTDDFTSECKILSADTNNTLKNDITCIIEGKEEDLHFNGVQVQYNFPSSMCDYAVTYLPYYYNREPGVGPTTATINDGSVVHDGAPVGGYSMNGVPKTKFYCDYDYETQLNSTNPKSGGKNCCSGSYTLNKWSSDTSGEHVVVTTESWGGKPGNCLSGPALKENKIDLDGYPLLNIKYVAGTGINQSYQVASPISLGLTENYYVANYFKPTEHTNLFPLSTFTQVALAKEFKEFGATNPYHLFECKDRAYETIARIRVMIREWNMVSEYNLGAAGNPDATGSEPGFDNGPYNDYNDFKDLGEDYPKEFSIF